MEWYPTPSYLVKRKVILDYLKTLKERDFLEVGSGAGDLLCSLEKRGYSGLGIDLSPEAIELAKKGLKSGTVKTEVGELKDIKGDYSIVIASEVLEHHEDDIGFLNQLKDRMKSGGYLLITVPAHMDKWGPNDEFCGHIRRYERAELVEKFKKSGLEPVLVYSYGVPVYNIMKPFYDRAIKKGAQKEEHLEERTEKSGGMWLFTGMKALFNLLFNDITMSPFYLLQKLFFRTDLGNGYFAVARKV